MVKSPSMAIRSKKSSPRFSVSPLCVSCTYTDVLEVGCEEAATDLTECNKSEFQNKQLRGRVLSIEDVKGLQPLLAETGELNPEFPEVRFFEHPAIEGVTDETITENVFVDIMVSCLEKKKKKDMWFEKRVNLWELADVKDPSEVLERFHHPLQPDIDLLYGPRINEKRQTPMIGVEVKLFSRFTGRGRKLAKTAGYEGYYAGLDEAISLLTLGLDYVELWHVYVLPLRIWNRYLARYGRKFAEKIKRDAKSLGYLGFHLLCDMVIEPLEIPIGYFATFLTINPECKRFEITWSRYLGSTPNFFSFFPHPLSKTRDLIINALKLESIKIRTQIWVCSNCGQSLGSKAYKDYDYCPKCGSKLQTDNYHLYPED